MRLAHELARSADESAVALVAAEELAQLAGTDAVVLYGNSHETGPQLLAHAGKGTRQGWQRAPVLVRAALRTRSEVWASHADMAGFSAIGVESDHAFVVPLVCDEQLLGALLVASARRAVLDRSTTSTVAGLISAIMSTLRRLALSADEARRDSLTGLPNKRAFRELLGSLLGTEPRGRAPVSLVLLDVDDFKKVNDTRGHPAGDRVLCQVARVILRALRADEEAFRVGGEEFAVVVSGGASDGARVAERVRTALAESTRENLPTISAGVAEAGTSTDLDELVAGADAALYRAKAAGKNRVVVAGQTDAARAEPHEPRSHSTLRDVAMAELPHVARSWLAAEKTCVGQAAFAVACRHLASTVDAVGASVSLIEGSRLVREATWLDPQLRPRIAKPPPVLSKASEVPLLGAPRVLRVASAPHASADVARLLVLGVKSALIAGIQVDGKLVGAVEVYETSHDAFSDGDVQRVARATREVSALVAQRTHAERLRRQYRTSVVSLCAAIKGGVAPRQEIERAGLLSRALAEQCGAGAGSAAVCELAGLVMMTTDGDTELRDAIELLLERRPVQRESALAETAFAYLAALRRHEARGGGELEALAELVNDTGTERPRSAVEALIRVVESSSWRPQKEGEARSESARAGQDRVDVGEHRGLVFPGGTDTSVTADQER